MFEALTNWIVYDLAGMQGTALGAALRFFVMDVTKILVLLTLVIYLMGRLRALLSGVPNKSTIEGWLAG